MIGLVLAVSTVLLAVVVVAAIWRDGRDLARYRADYRQKFGGDR